MPQLIRIILSALLITTPICFAATPLFENNNSKLNVSLNNFLALSCDTTGNLCTAVGLDNNGDDPSLLVYRSQDAGATWGTPVYLSKAPNSKSVNEQGLATDIHCDATAAQRCSIISSAKIDKDVVILVYNTLEGQQEWSQPIILPLPSSNLQKEGQYVYAKLSCGYSGFSCVIAGTSRVGINTVPLLYTTKNAGHKWALVSSFREPWYTRSNGISLFNVHCDNSGFLCKAVGYALTRNSLWSNYYTSKPVVYTTEDGGAHWSDPVVLPSDIDGDKKASTLTSVTCDGTGMQCMALGFTINLEANKSRFYSFTTSNGGGNWEKRQWINSDYSLESLAAVACDDAMVNCTAVGHMAKMFANESGGFYLRGLIYSTTANAQTWEKDTSQSFTGFSYLTDISCSKYDGQCVAVGVQEAINSTVRTQAVKHALSTTELLRKLPTVVLPKS